MEEQCLLPSCRRHPKSIVVVSSNDHQVVISSKVALKVSWESSTESVRTECKMLQRLEEHHVTGVEQCLAMDTYPGTVTKTYNTQQQQQRTMIVLQPVMEDTASLVNSIGLIPSNELQQQATQQVIRTMLQMLAAQVATTDVQPLISATTGHVLFIDMTEAQIIAREPSSLELALCRSFVSEMMVLIPEKMTTVAAQAMEQELVIMSSRYSQQQQQPQQQISDNGTLPILDRIPLSIRDILKDQVPFLTQTSLAIL